MEELKAIFFEYKYVWRTIIILISAIIIRKIIYVFLNRYIEQSSQLIKVEPTKYRFLKNAVSAIIYLGAAILIIYEIPTFKTLAVSLFAGAGIFAAFLGFASQQAFSNIVSGIFIVIFKPFRVGDFVRLDDQTAGQVEDITLRHTVINGLENRRIIIPNSNISASTIVNSSIQDEKICRFMEFGISYDSDIDLAMDIIRDEAMKHPDCIDNRNEEDKQKKVPQVIIRLINFGESSVNLRAYVWAKDHPTSFFMHCDLNYSIKKRFDKEGIEIPFPYRTVVLKNAEEISKITAQNRGKTEN
ncbi:mechanosensitive ion channel family protein [Flexithrix dorotheae]|uniref:mechanosensitive ion channel family protein n=1 Tax=Flexithrix dorotheae TaxID=70993 RepID=UPI00035C489C|nr:mechanosensitive ion channel family protein [Flexithrix dorotheae]